MQGAVNCVSRGLTAIAARFEDLKKNHKRSIEAVALFDVLEHIQDDEDFLIKLRSFMDKDASLYITVPAYMFLWSSEDDYAQHHRRYTLGALVSLLRRAGFSISYASYFFLPLVLPIFLFRVLPSRLGWRENSLERNKQEHSGGGLLEKILRVSLAFERYILKFLRLPCGASLMVVAKPTLPR